VVLDEGRADAVTVLARVAMAARCRLPRLWNDQECSVSDVCDVPERLYIAAADGTADRID